MSSSGSTHRETSWNRTRKIHYIRNRNSCAGSQRRMHVDVCMHVVACMYIKVIWNYGCMYACLYEFVCICMFCLSPYRGVIIGNQPSTLHPKTRNSTNAIVQCCKTMWVKLWPHAHRVLFYFSRLLLPCRPPQPVLKETPPWTRCTVLFATLHKGIDWVSVTGVHRALLIPDYYSSRRTSHNTCIARAYVAMYVYLYVYVRVCACQCACVYVWVIRCMYVRLRGYICIVCVCMYACRRAGINFTYVCMYA